MANNCEPFIMLPLACLVYCLGITCGVCLIRCLPASLAVPLLEMLRQRVPNAPNITNSNPNPNPPASPGTIDALPIVVFGQVSDEFNQTECTIRQGDYEANEEVKKLPCGHLFHARCAATWLSITRICPLCRHRITSARL